VANITITNCDLGSVVLELGAAEDGTLVNAALTTETLVAGTILGRLAADGTWGPFAAAGAGGLEIPKAVLTYDLDPLATLGSVAVQVMTAGKVNADRLIVHGGGTVTAAVLDGLRSYSIVAIATDQLSEIDNPQA
jgi:hypothetical protein